MKRQTITLVLGLFIAPLWIFGAEKEDSPPPNTNSLYFGGTGSYFAASLTRGWSAGGYIGVQSNFGREDIALVNTFKIEYLGAYTHKFSPAHEQKGVIFSYIVGIRVLLGTPYVFMDFSAGFTDLSNTTFKRKLDWGYFLTSIDLGFNVPLMEMLKLQIILSSVWEAPNISFLGLKLGLQILL